MTIKIAWAITGAGCWLTESFEVLGDLLRKENLKIDLFFSQAGREVAQCYGVFKPPVPANSPFIEKVREIPNFNEDIFTDDYVERYQWLGPKDVEEDLEEEACEERDFEYDEAIHDVIFEIDEGASFPSAASASNDKYDVIIISPASGNTVSKIANGIADNLVTNLALMGSKSKKTDILVVPTDLKVGSVKSYLPIMLHPETCKKCQECSAMWACKPGAIRRKRGKIWLNRLKCIGCLDCVRYCQFGVITFLEEITVTVQKREADAAKKLAAQKQFVLLDSPNKIQPYLKAKLKIKS